MNLDEDFHKVTGTQINVNHKIRKIQPVDNNIYLKRESLKKEQGPSTVYVIQSLKPNILAVVLSMPLKL